MDGDSAQDCILIYLETRKEPNNFSTKLTKSRYTEKGQMPEPNTSWPEGVQGAVSLTYDGSRLGHLELVAPALRKMGVHATFFVDLHSALQHVYGWRSVVANGHELGNGCLLNSGDLLSWTPQMIAEEIASTDEGIQDVFGPSRHCPFAFPFGPPICGGYQDYRDVLTKADRIARSGNDGFNDPENCRFQYLSCIRADGLTGSELISLTADAIRSGEWIIWTFEGIGEGENAVDLGAHQSLLLWLSAHPDIWTSPLGTVSEYLKSHRKAQFHVV
jgi:hypothetical protein